MQKNKEMILGSFSSIDLQPLFTFLGTVERIATFKLLGIHLDKICPGPLHTH